MQEVLEAIHRLERKLDGHYDSLDKRIRALEERDCVQRDQIDNIYDIIKNMASRGEGVLKRESGRCAFDKRAVYDTFDRYGYDRREALCTLRKGAHLICDCQRKNTRPVRAGGKIVRAVVVTMND